MLATIYHSGGFVAAATAQNRAEQWDSVASTHTSWDTAGVVLSQRALTSDEVARFAERQTTQTASDNRDILQTKALQALTVNSDYLALATPTAAQTTAQVKALTRECSGLIRMLLGQLDDTAGT